MELAARWERFWGDAVNRQVARAAVSVAAAGVLVKLIATVKEFTVAGLYGRSDAMDAFLAAALLPALLVNLISESMNQALIPTFIRVREQEGNRSAQQLLSSAMLVVCVLLSVAALILALAAPAVFPLIASSFSPEKMTLARHLFYALLPTVLLAGIASNCTSVLNATGRFALPALAPAIIPLIILVGAPALAVYFGIWAMVIATLAGTLFYAMLTSSMLTARGFCFSLRWHGFNEPTREVARQYCPVLLSGVVASSGLLVDQSMAAMLPAGSVSALVYANRFVSVLVALLAGAVATAVTPHFSELVARRDWLGCRRSANNWIGIMAAVSIPLTVALVLGAEPLIRLTFQHGVFTAEDTSVVTPVLAMYALQIPFFVCSRVYYRVIIALRRTDLIFYCGLINLGLDIALNIVLMHWFGIAGIALATSLWTVATFLFLAYWSRKLLHQHIQHGGTA
ncbi:MAG: polysaccharide biosynthesis C-terminal domain-containing protein [Acidobacteriota bacterium]|nr:polysaccharide biosynthesis C-terminal domain-containing protein [Acidobacteriota bacterium]